MTAATELPLVTIGIPCLNEEAYIDACLTCATEQDYPADKLEIILADGGSTDRTLEILERWSQDDSRIQVVDNPRRIQAAGMNEIIRRSTGAVLVRMDAHGEYSRNYVRKCIEVLERTGADNAGGAQRARARSWFQQALCAALDSPLGVGGASYRSADKEGFVDTVFAGAFRRRVFEQVGMFDSGAVTNEDAELNQRILEGGGKIYLSREIEAYYYPRDSFRALSKQYFKYGMGRARTLLKRRRLLTLRPVIPFLTVVGGTALLVTSGVQPFTVPAFGLYAVATGAEAIRVGRRVGLWAIPVIHAIFPVLHVSHGVGFGVGLVRYLASPDWSEPERLQPLAATEPV